MTNHLMLIQGIVFNEKICMININEKMFKIMQEISITTSFIEKGPSLLPNFLCIFCANFSTSLIY